MKVNIVGKNITVTEGISDKIHKKLDVLTKYFIISEDDVANVLVPAIILQNKNFSNPNALCDSSKSGGCDDDLYAAIDLAVDKLEDQIRRTKMTFNT